MQVEALYDHGRLVLAGPLRFKHERVRLLVTVPDDEVEMHNPYGLPPDVLERTNATRARMVAILNEPLPPEGEVPELSPKQLERLEAFELRDEISSNR